MPEPAADPDLPKIRRVALHALVAGSVFMAVKFGIWWLTDSVAVLSDALESIINVVAAGFMLYSIHLSNRPADQNHPYGHGKVEFLAVGLEGCMILGAGLVITWQAVTRLFTQPPLDHLPYGITALSILALLDLGLAIYVWRAGRRYNNQILLADGRHLLTDFVSTLGVIGGLSLVIATGHPWIDPVAALVMATLILWASWHLLWKSISGLMDRSDPADDAAIREVLDRAVEANRIAGYHKVRHRHQGTFHWVDMHLQVDPELTVAQSHDLASAIEREIETALGEGNATAHVEPASGQARSAEANGNESTEKNS